MSLTDLDLDFFVMLLFTVLINLNILYLPLLLS